MIAVYRQFIHMRQRSLQNKHRHQTRLADGVYMGNGSEYKSHVDIGLEFFYFS